MENETFYGDGHKQFSKLSTRVENYFRPAKSVLHRSFEISALHVKASAQKKNKWLFSSPVFCGWEIKSIIKAFQQKINPNRSFAQGLRQIKQNTKQRYLMAERLRFYWRA